MITHIVLVKFFSGSTDEQKKRWRDEVVGLKEKCSQVKDIRFGNKIFAFERLKQNDPGWEDGVVMTFDNLQDLQTYATSEAHDQYIVVTGGYTREKLIYDIES